MSRKPSQHKDVPPNIEFLPAPQPLKVYKYTDIPRHKFDPEGKQLVDVEKMADAMIQYARQGMSFSTIAGRLGYLPDELRKIMNNNPDLYRAMAFGVGLGSEEMTDRLYKKAVQEGDMSAIMTWLKARGGFEPPRAVSQGGNVSLKSGDTTVTIDLDNLKAMTHEQSNLRLPSSGIGDLNSILDSDSGR